MNAPAGSSDSDDDTPQLRPDTLALLRSVLAEKEAARQAEAHEGDVTAGSANVALATSEDWQLSQFWYDEGTSRALAAEVLVCAEARRAAASAGGAGSDGIVRVACLSCPSTFKALLAAGLPPWVSARLFEFDPRFAAFGPAFVQYDFNAPTSGLPPDLRGATDVFVMDPPFLNADCLAGFARTLYALRRDNGVRVLLATGAVMLPHARRLLGLRPTRSQIGHAGARLSNPFALYVNYDEGGRLGGVDEEAEAAAARGGGGGSGHAEGGGGGAEER